MPDDRYDIEVSMNDIYPILRENNEHPDDRITKLYAYIRKQDNIIENQRLRLEQSLAIQSSSVNRPIDERIERLQRSMREQDKWTDELLGRLNKWQEALRVLIGSLPQSDIDDTFGENKYQAYKDLETIKTVNRELVNELNSLQAESFWRETLDETIQKVIDRSKEDKSGEKDS